MTRHVSAAIVHSPWLLCVVLALPNMIFHIISAYVPYEDSPYQRRVAFWDALAGELSVVTELSDVFALVGFDANAHIGSVASPSIGPYEFQPENENGAALWATAEENELAIVNTFYSAEPTWAWPS